MTPPALAEPFVPLIHETPDQIALRGGAAMIPALVATLGTLDPAALTLGGFFQIDAPDTATAEA